MATKPYTPPAYTRYSREEWQQAAATPQGADMILNPERHAQYVSTGPLIGANSTRVAPDVELRRDFRNRSDEFGELMTTAARTDPRAALKSEYLASLNGGMDVMRNVLAAASPSLAQEAVAHWADVGTGRGGRDFVTMAASVQPEAVIRGMSGYEGNLRYANWDEQVLLTAARTLVERDPQRALTLANELKGSEYMMNRNGMDDVVTALANGHHVTPQRVARRQGEDGTIPYDQALAQQRGIAVEEITAARNAPAPAIDLERSAAIEAARGVDLTDGISNAEKQILIEATGRQTDGRNGRADGKVDGKYGAGSLRAEAEVRTDLAAGRLDGLPPDVLEKISSVFAPETANGMSVSNPDNVRASTVGGQAQNQGNGRGA